ncbi:MAG: hypothetical protein ACQEXJ_09240 [Myxococcota bacterium]
MNTRLVRIAAALALVVLSWGLSAPARAGATEARPSVLDAGRSYASPVGEVRWLDAAPDTLLVSDLRRGVAAIDTREGRVRWNHGAMGGRLDRVWRLGDYVVVAGVGLEVLARGSGAVLWRRTLGCATGGPCVERAWWAGPDGVLVSGSGPSHRRLGLLGVTDGAPRWRRVAPVKAPRDVQVAGDVVVIRDGGTPPTLRFVDLATGTERGRWTWDGAGARPEAVGFAATPDGALVWDLAPGGDLVARIVRVSSSGEAVDEARLLRRPGLDGAATRARPLGGGLTWLAGAGDDGASLVRAPLDGDGAVRVDSVAPRPRPVVVDGRIVAVGHEARGVQALGFADEGASPAWERTVPGHEAAELVAVGRDVLVAAGPEPARIAVLSPDDGSPEIVGALDAPAGGVHAAGRAGGVLYVATGGGVRGLPIHPLERLEVVVGKLLEDGRPAAAEERLAPLRTFESGVPALARLRERVHRTRLDRLRARFADGDVAPGLASLEASLRGEPSGRVERLVSLAPHVASMVGDFVLGRREAPGGAVCAAIPELARALVERLGRDGDALRDAGRGAEDDVRAAALVLAGASLRAGHPADAAALVGAWRDGGFSREPGVAALHRVAAARALYRWLADHGPALVGEDPEARQRAREALAASPWPAVALDSETFLPRRLDLVVDPDRERSRRAARALVTDLEAEIARVRRDLGGGLGEPGCVAVCRSLGETCGGRCRAPTACVEAAENCREGCGRDGRARWRPPGMVRDGARCTTDE